MQNEMISVSVIEIPNLKAMSFVFLEKGHTHNENDTAHSCIEKAKSGVRIDHPYQWQTLIQAACRKNPFDVTWMNHTDFYDFSTTLGGIYTMLCSNVNKQVKDIHGNPSRIRWLDLRHVMFEYAISGV